MGGVSCPPVSPPPISAVMPRSSHLPMLDTRVPALKLRPSPILLACVKKEQDFMHALGWLQRIKQQCAKTLSL